MSDVRSACLSPVFRSAGWTPPILLLLFLSCSSSGPSTPGGAGVGGAMPENHWRASGGRTAVSSGNASGLAGGTSAGIASAVSGSVTEGGGTGSRDGGPSSAAGRGATHGPNNVSAGSAAQAGTVAAPPRGAAGRATTGGRAGASGRANGAAASGWTAGGVPGTTGGTSGAGTPIDDCAQAVGDSSPSPTALTLSGNLGTHDPVMIKANGVYYEFQTGPGIPTKTSTNLTTWQGGRSVFTANPAWIAGSVPGATDLWAPDISYFGGKYHLYYSASTFGSNRSCIGHATTLDLASAVWTDHGSVVCSNAAGSSDNWNAIDPNVAIDAQGTPWLAFGSFWSGLKMVKLTATGERADTSLLALASRPSAGGALEAPFIVYRCGYYYLFASFDSCCKGVDSTYKIAVGRATGITGPYADKAGMAMLSGGGTILLESGSRWKGPGHNAVLFEGDRAYAIYHSYDANANGASMLRIAELVWDAQGWPVVGGP